MIMASWRTSVTDEDAAAAARALQARLETQHPDGPWTDAIKGLPPEQRLALALDHLPLPAAFNEAAISLRALIGIHMEEQRDPTASLKLLYWISAVASFMPERAAKAQVPGFNVVITIPGTRLFGLKADWSSLGYEKLPLLVARDIRMLIALWGEPKTHGTLLKQHQALWDEYEGKLVERIRRSDQATADQLARSLDAGGGIPLPIRIVEGREP